ncbi:MAG: hypothetical protein ACRDI0_13710 [Actinomycetota bacterium]
MDPPGSPDEPLESVLREVIRRTESRAFAHEDPGSYRAGIHASVEATRIVLQAALPVLGHLPPSGDGRRFGLTDRGEALRLIESF